jgi:hypothetical protein
VVAAVVAACLVAAALMAKESGLGWQLGISGEQAMAGLEEHARKIRAAADQVMPSGIIQIRRSVTAEEVEQFTSRWNEDRTTFRVTELYNGLSREPWNPPMGVEFAPRRQPLPVEAFAACPQCRIDHYPLIVGRHDIDNVLCLIRECVYCHSTWTQQEPA